MRNASSRLRRIAIFAGIALLVVSGWYFWQREPRYRGVPASAYVLDLIGPVSPPTQTPLSAIREMGPELAVPALLGVIQSEISTWSKYYPAIYAKTHGSLKKMLPIPHASERIVGAAFVFINSFGPEASAATPELVKLYDRQPHHTTYTLQTIGPSASNAIPTLIRGLHPTNGLCYVPASALWQIDPSNDFTSEAISRLPSNGELRTALRQLALRQSQLIHHSKDTASRWGTCQILGLLRTESEPAISALKAFLQDENPRVRAKAAEMLEFFGTAAVGATNELSRLLADEWQMVREAVTNSLKNIQASEPR